MLWAIGIFFLRNCSNTSYGLKREWKYFFYKPKDESVKEAVYHTRKEGGRTAISVDWNERNE